MIDIDLSKYEKSITENIDKNNLKKIIEYLLSQKCDYIKELLEDYFDIFTFDYDEFIIKFNKLNDKYNNNLINEIKNDMNILEEFYSI